MNEKVANQTFTRTGVENMATPERPGSSRHESPNGRSLPRRVANRWHSLIVSNIAIALGSRMSGHKSEIYISNMRVKMPNGFTNVPDLAIVSTEPAFADQNADLLLNPTIVVEVLSSESSFMDKTQKLESLLATDSVKECLLVKQDEMRVEHYTKQNAKQWLYRIYNERDDIISLEPVNCKIALSEMYSQVKFRPAEFSAKAVN